MQSVHIICVGKLKEAFYEEAVKEYTKRLSAHCRLTIEELPEVRVSTAPSPAEVKAALQKEAENISAHIPKGSAVVAMCIEGKTRSSEEFSSLLSGYADRGISRICFIIGGSFGLDAALKAGADVRLSMSPMTFPHHLARVMLLEQLYRGFQIAAGSKYHK